MLNKRVGLYARTGTFDKQDPEMQPRDMREYAGIRGWMINKGYEDRGFTGTDSNLPMLKQLLSDAKQRRFDIVPLFGSSTAGAEVCAKSYSCFKSWRITASSFTVSNTRSISQPVMADS